MKWNVEDKKNNCTIELVSAECKTSSTEGWGYNKTNDHWVVNETFSKKKSSNFIVETVFTDLYPYYKYICSSRVLNEAGWSEKSTDVNAFTQEARKNSFFLFFFF